MTAWLGCVQKPPKPHLHWDLCSGQWSKQDQESQPVFSKGRVRFDWGESGSLLHPCPGWTLTSSCTISQVALFGFKRKEGEQLLVHPKSDGNASTHIQMCAHQSESKQSPPGRHCCVQVNINTYRQAHLCCSSVWMHSKILHWHLGTGPNWGGKGLGSVWVM